MDRRRVSAACRWHDGWALGSVLGGSASGAAEARLDAGQIGVMRGENAWRAWNA